MLTRDSLLTISLHEYEVLRAEMVNTVDRQYSIGNWAISSVAVIVAAFIAGWGTLREYPLLLIAAIYLIVPLLVTSHVLAWTHVISKIAGLGKRLYRIEENIAVLVGQETLREVYHLPPTETANPYIYLVGWEHRLWRGQKNPRIEATTTMIIGAVAVIYASSGVLGTFAWRRLLGSSEGPSLLVMVAIALLYVLSWYAFRRYVTNVTA